MTLSSFASALQTGLGTSCTAYHYTAPVNKSVPYVVWQEDSGNDFIADGKHAETGYEGTVDLFTATEYDSLVTTIQGVLDNTCSWYLNSVQFEEDTGLIHYEWVFNG